MSILKKNEVQTIMAKKKQKEQNQPLDSTEETLMSLEQSLTKTELYIEENKNSLSLIVGAIIVIFAAYYAYKEYYVKPKGVKAQNTLFAAENQFRNGNYDLALNGEEGGHAGLLDVIDDFSGTPAGDLAQAYAGLSYAKQGDFATAIDYLEAYKGSGTVSEPIIKGALADCYAETGDLDKAFATYKEAAQLNDNKLSAPVMWSKAAMMAEALSKTEEAKTIYQALVKDYESTREGQEAKKMLAKLGVY